ncbi:hypothetical protein [Bdellovibrio sp. BCCA]|uniref:hypothetical protein n=1 Tax=Bdellovibrio sp. BCCA TaxID=3136281 RepID=UPI0030F2076A
MTRSLQYLILNNGVAAFLTITLAACSPSPSPSSEELIKTSVPTFDGSDNYSTTTPTTKFVLVGTCDTKSYGLEYSFDGSSWQRLADNCASGRFTVHLIVRGLLDIYVRAKTKMGHTAAAKARIRFVLPATSASFQVVSSANAIEDTSGKVQFTSSIAGTDGHFSSPTMNLQTGITGIVYGP